LLPLAVTLQLKAEKSAHSDTIQSVAFSPDGTKIVSGSDDETIKVWDATNPRPCNPWEWETVYGQFPDFDPDNADSDFNPEEFTWYWKNVTTGDARREYSTVGVFSAPIRPSLA